MPEQVGNGITRRETMKTGLMAATVVAFLQDIAVPAPAADETDVPFTDYPANYTVNGNPKAENRFLDIRTIDGHITPNDKFFFIQHYNRPEIDGNSYRLKLTGMVQRPSELSLSDLQGMKRVEVVNGYECSGNSARFFDGLSSCGRFTGVPLRDVLKRVGVGAKAREVVFFGTDRKKEDIVFRQDTYKLVQQFGRSITLENALKPEPLLAYALNGQPLARDQGFPVRLIMPGWYGVCNVKWLSEIHLQQDRYLGNFQARWYRDLRGVGGTGADDDPNTQWVETEVTRMRLKSVIARVRKSSSAYQVFGFVLNDGTPLKSVEVSVDGGPWQAAALDRANTRFGWKLFTFDWKNATPGEHTLVSRATDVDGNVQPTRSDLSRKKTFLEDNAQFPRKLKIA
jgi:DMSO/TMAO reductase YedYZ molybdopterin-dependent catalytic subunit